MKKTRKYCQKKDVKEIYIDAIGNILFLLMTITDYKKQFNIIDIRLLL